MLITVKSNYGLRQSGRIVLKTPADKPFDVPEEKARELEQRGIAVIVEEDPPKGEADSQKALSKMKLEELKSLANERGIEGASGMKKAELVEALTAQSKESEVGEEGESEE